MIILDKEVNLLSSLKVGEKCIVKDLKMEGKGKRRMFDLGLIKDTVVEAVLSSPSGDPVAYCIRGALIALRKQDTSKIAIVKI